MKSNTHMVFDWSSSAFKQIEMLLFLYKPHSVQHVLSQTFMGCDSVRIKNAAHFTPCLVLSWFGFLSNHYNDVIVSAMALQITSLKIVYSMVCSAADPRKHQSSALLTFVRGIHRWPLNSPHKGPVTRKMLQYGDIDLDQHGLSNVLLPGTIPVAPFTNMV